MEIVTQHYRDSFWQGYSFLKRNFCKTKENFGQLNYVFSRLSDLHLYYSHNLEQICNFIVKPSSRGGLTYHEAFNQFLDYIKEESTYHKHLSEQIRTLIKKHLDSQVEVFINCFKADEEELRRDQVVSSSSKTAYPLTIFNSQQHFEKLQEKCNESFNRLKEHEMKYFDQLSKALKEMLRKKEYKNIDKIVKEMKVEQAKQEYKAVIKETQDKRNEYTEKFKAHADAYENIDKTYINCVRKSILEYSSLINKYCIDRQRSLNENIIPKVNEIHAEHDINNFILKYETFGLPPSAITQENFSVNRVVVPEAEPKKDDPNRLLIIESVHNFVAYFSETQNEQRQLREDMKEYFIKADKGILTEEEYNQLISLFEKGELGISYQLLFLKFLNERRTGGKEISVESFAIFSKILLKIMEHSQQEHIDFTTRYKICNWCFVLSETFFVKDENNRSKYMITEINKTGIFDRVEWVCFFKYILLEKLSNRSNFMNYQFQLPKKGMNISKEFETKIFTIAQNLKFLNKSKDDIIALIEHLCKKYHQTNELFERVKEKLPIFLH